MDRPTGLPIAHGRCVPCDPARAPLGAAALVASVVLSVAVCGLHTDRVAFAQAAEQGESAGQVRMTFFNESWADVLRKVAEQTGSQLVMARAPAGRWTNSSTRRCSRAEAVQTVNRELEKTSFRVIEQGPYLVVLHLDSVRERYGRPAVFRAPETVGDEANGGSPRPGANGPSRVVPVSAEVPATTAPAVGSALAERAAEVEWKPPVRSPTGASDRTEVVRVSTRRRGATEVAKTIYAGLRSRSELVEAGPSGLPAFRFRSHAAPGATSRGAAANGTQSATCTIGIDAARQELVIEAPSAAAQSLVELARFVDAVVPHTGSQVTLVGTATPMAEVVGELEPALRRLVAPPRPLGEFAQAPGAAQPPRAEPVQPPPANPGQPPKGADLPATRLEGLRGPVTIRDVPGIGMVVTGNDADVEAVVRIVRELDRVAAVARPNIHLLLLRHVDSQALATLLADVYRELTALRLGGTNPRAQVAILPVTRPNAVLVLAGQAEMQSVLDLAEKLDQPVDPLLQFEVFALKSAVAADVVRTLESLFPSAAGTGQGNQAPQGTAAAGGLRWRVRAVADQRTNSVIVQAAPDDLAHVSTIVRRMDRDSSSAVNRIRIFPLHNAVADELVGVVNDALQGLFSSTGSTTGGGGPIGAGPGGGGGAAAAAGSREAKSIVLEFLATDGKAESLLRSGLLTDIRVTADPRVNALVVSAPEASLPLMAELIRQLDLPTSNVAEIKVFALTNSDATALAELLGTLFGSQNAQGNRSGQPAAQGLQVVGAEDASSGLVPLRFSVDVRTNSLIAIGGAEALRVVEAILLRLDQTDVRQRKTTVVKLKNSPAADVAAALQAFLQSQRQLAQIDPELISNVELLEQEIVVQAEPVSNSLLISATPRYYDEIMRIVAKLDEAPAQVVIQVLIVEVELQNTDEFGVELGFQDSILFNRGLTNLENFLTIDNSISDPGTGIVTTTQQVVNQEIVPGFLFNNQQLGNNPALNRSKVGKQGLSNFSLGRINSDLGFGGLVLSASSEAVSVLIRALSAQRNVQILSRPQIRTVDNQLAQIQVGQQVPVVSGASTNNLGGITPVLGTPQQVGIILQVTPRITPDGTIVMETIANKSRISGQGVPIITDPTTGAVVESPIFDLTEARATVAVPDGQTIVLGGMITKNDDALHRKVPWLGDLPLIGAAFRFDSVTSRRTELLIFMTPRIVHNTADSEAIKRVEAERMHFLVEEAESIHGPIYAVPNEPAFDPACPPPQFPNRGDFGMPGPNLPEANDPSVPTTVMPAVPAPVRTAPFVPAPAAPGTIQQQSYEVPRPVPRPTAPPAAPSRSRWIPRLLPGRN